MPAEAPSRGPGRAFALLAAFAAAHLAFLSACLLYPDLNLGYPFVGGDAHDWIANGLHLAGEEVRYSGRPPLVPLVLAALAKAGALPLFPLVVQLLAHATALLVFRVLSRLLGTGPAVAGALLLLLNATWVRLSFDVMADVTAASLLASSAALFLLARDEPRAYPAAGLLAGLSALAQQTAFLLPLPALLTLLVARRRHLRSPLALAGALLFALPPAAWLLARRAAGGSGVAWWWLLAPPGLDALLHLLVATASFAGLPLLLLAAWGAASSWRSPDGRDLAATLLGAIAAVGGFFLAYDFRDQRFVASLFPLLVLLAAAGLARVPSRAGKAAAAACALAFGVVPSWEPVSAVPGVVLWPLPAVELAGDVRRGPIGDARLVPGTLRVEVRPAREVLRAAPWALALRTRLAAVPTEPADRPALGHVASALFVHDAANAGDRYVETNRLGNALGTKVKFVPNTWLGRYGPFLRVAPAASFDRYALFRCVLPGGEDGHLLAAARGGPVERELAALAGRAPVPSPAGPGGAPEARAIAARLGERDGLILVFDPGGTDPTILFLPFLARSTDLLLLNQEGARAAAWRIEYVEGEPVVRIGRATLRRAEIPGRACRVIRFDPAS